MFRVLIPFILFASDAFPQSPGTNTSLSEKYFHFRERLVNEFTLGIGNDFGQSIPASVRKTFDRNYSNEHTISWGDATIDLAYYIGTLATEYALLSKQEKPASQTLKELYYALEAFNRLDYYAEEYYGYPPSLNGFFVRNDVGRDLFRDKRKNNKYHVALKILNEGSSDSLNNIESEWTGYYLHNNLKRFAVSKDQVFHLMVAMALIVKCIPSGENYPEHKFKDGEASFVQEAKNITDRMMNWIHPINKSNIFFNWRVSKPNGKKTGAGYNAWSFAYGMNLGQQKISGTENPVKKGFSWWLAKAVYNITWLAFKPIYFFNRSEGVKTLSLAAISNSCVENADKLYRYSFFSEKYPSYHIPLLYGYLYNKITKQPDLSLYKKLLEEVPVEGPHNRRFAGFSNYNWSSTSLIIHPERRGQAQAFFPGNYNAIDFMFMYNLYLLCSNESY
ncbi:MAG: hypothetical protein ACHQNT_03970 [Bacteroidia bacterium]